MKVFDIEWAKGRGQLPFRLFKMFYELNDPRLAEGHLKTLKNPSLEDNLHSSIEEFTNLHSQKLIALISSTLMEEYLSSFESKEEVEMAFKHWEESFQKILEMTDKHIKH